MKRSDLVKQQEQITSINDLIKIQKGLGQEVSESDFIEDTDAKQVKEVLAIEESENITREDAIAQICGVSKQTKSSSKNGSKSGSKSKKKNSAIAKKDTSSLANKGKQTRSKSQKAKDVAAVKRGGEAAIREDNLEKESYVRMKKILAEQEWSETQELLTEEVEDDSEEIIDAVFSEYEGKSTPSLEGEDEEDLLALPGWNI